MDKKFIKQIHKIHVEHNAQINIAPHPRIFNIDSKNKIYIVKVDGKKYALLNPVVIFDELFVDGFREVDV